ncbi:MAG: 23S rRNA (uracil(1939)-C(5))-methyltransferase RlmD [Lachnospiraceae bacterium]|nr:23S rRNA (uracil(1939)-C(5))-methyltransferase RlmD [Lachnospiraceae bacterium]
MEQKREYRNRKTNQSKKKQEFQGRKSGKPEQKQKFQGRKSGKPEQKQKFQGRESGKPEQKQGKNVVCPYYKKCGGCAYIEQDYAWQLKEKQKQVSKLLTPHCHVMKIVGMEQPFFYRNKVHAAFGRTRKGEVVAGIYAAGTHDIIDIDKCMIENEKADAIIRDIKGLLKSFKIKTYDEDTGYGLLRHVLIRTGHKTGQIMVVLVLSSPILPSKNNFVKAIRKLHPEISTVVLNVNDKKTSMVLGERDIVLYGKGYIEDILCGKRYRISPQSFYQINSVQTEALYQKAIEFAGLNGTETIIDAYSGIGTIGITVSSHVKEVLCVELNQDAVKDARANAKINDVKNVKFICEDAGEFMVKLAQQNATADVVFMDPPRAGSDEAFLSSIVKMAPEKVVYISCNPVTLERDICYLEKRGYEAVKACPYDLFPFTGHVEVVTCLQRRDI